MLRYSIIIGCTLTILSVTATQAYSQAVAFNHFHVHGWLQGPTDMIAEETFMRTNVAAFGSRTGTRPAYSSFGSSGFVAQVPAVISQIGTMNNIGFGYSAGGLITRSVSHTQGTVATPAPSNVFVRGFVTLCTPNAGAFMALEYPAFAREYARAETKILRGPMTSILANFLGSLLSEAVGYALWFSKQFNSWFAIRDDMAPGSSYLTSINGSTTGAVEASLPIGRAAVWADFGELRLPGFQGGIPERDRYRDKIFQARDNANQHAREADRLRSVRTWWNAWVVGPRIGWHKGKDSDWRDTRDGLMDMNNSWDQHTSHRALSDTFIHRGSQQALPPGGNLFFRQVLNGATNNEVTHGEALSPEGSTAIRTALQDLGIF